MISLTVIAVGRLKASWLREGCAEYLKRMGAWSHAAVIEVEEYRLEDSPSPARIAECIEKEGERILAKLPKNTAAVALCIEGGGLSSEGLAELLECSAANGAGKLAFIIGGSYGLSERVKKAAIERISLSPMTFPHQLARVLLLEQLYRALSIGARAKYHK